jgi:hypothetical protein
MLKVVKRPPVVTVVALRSPGTKGKIKEKKYYRSAKLLKFGSEVTPTMQQDSIHIAEIFFGFFSIYKVGSSILSYGLFWGMIYGITASFLKRTLNASSGTMLNASSGFMLAYYLTWMMESIAGLVFGWLFTVYISSPQEKSAKRTRLFWVMLLSAALLVGSSIIFFLCIPRLGDESSSGINLSTMFTIICFAVMMISINGYMSAMNLMTQKEAGNAAHYGLTSGFNAVGQIIATGIIIYFGLNNNNSVDNVAPAVLGVGFVLISIFIIISLTCGQYWPCCVCHIYNEYWPCCVCRIYNQYWSYDKCCICGESLLHWHWIHWKSDDKQPSDNGGNVKYVANEVGTWLVFLFVIACWIALFAFLPWSVDWYASTYYSEDVGSPEYNRGVLIASWARFYQQLVMAGCSFFMLFVSKSFFENNHQWNRRQEKSKFKAIWIFTLIGLTVYSGCLFVAAFTDSPDLAYAAFVVSGIGMAAIFPLNGFQSYHIFSLNDNNNNKTVAASPFTCTGYYDNRQKINAAAMIGQIIILSVTYFGFHFNYKWVLITGSAAGGIAIFLGILLIIVTPYNFEKCNYYDKVSMKDPTPMMEVEDPALMMEVEDPALMMEVEDPALMMEVEDLDPYVF